MLGNNSHSVASKLRTPSLWDSRPVLWQSLLQSSLRFPSPAQCVCLVDMQRTLTCPLRCSHCGSSPRPIQRSVPDASRQSSQTFHPMLFCRIQIPPLSQIRFGPKTIISAGMKITGPIMIMMIQRSRHDDDGLNQSLQNSSFRAASSTGHYGRKL